MRISRALIVVPVSLFWLLAGVGRAAETKAPWQADWEKTVEAAKKEGKLVAAIPASAELRKAIGEVFSQAISRHRARPDQRARPIQRRQDRRRTCCRRALLRFIDQRHVDAV